VAELPTPDALPELSAAPTVTVWLPGRDRSAAAQPVPRTVVARFPLMKISESMPDGASTLSVGWFHDEVRTVEDLERRDVELITGLVEGEGDPGRPDLIGAKVGGPPGATPGPRVVTVIVPVGAEVPPLGSTATT
jgi:hypothetical protein